MTDGGRPDCTFSNLDASGCVPFSEFLRAMQSGDCLAPRGVCFSMTQTVHDKHGHELDGDFDPKGHDGCDHRETTEWKAEHPKERKKKMPKQNTLTETISPEPAQEAPTTAIVLPEAPAPVVTTATVGVDAAVGQMKSLLPEGADPALMVGGAATLAVVGAAIKFGPSVMKARAERAEREHEEKMKRLELEEKKAEKQDEQHGHCEAARASLAAQVTALAARVEAAEAAAKNAAEAAKKGESLSLGDFDPEEVEERIEKLEKALKVAKSAKKKKGK